MSYHVFISYPRIADERGAVSDIRAHLDRELKIKTGDRNLVVFQDRSGLAGGDPWNEVLEEELKIANAFVLLLCPLWLTSDWCRKELNLYLAYGKQRAVDRPIVPLRWERTELAHAQTEEQEAMLALIKRHEEVPWDKLRHRNSSDKGYREAISDFAEAVVAKLVGQ